MALFSHLVIVHIMVVDKRYSCSAIVALDFRDETGQAFSFTQCCQVSALIENPTEEPFKTMGFTRGGGGEEYSGKFLVGACRPVFKS